MGGLSKALVPLCLTLLWGCGGEDLSLPVDPGGPPSADNSTIEADPKSIVGNVWVVDVATGAATKLAPHSESYQDELPSWFPDGKRIAFQSNRTGRWEVWVINADGTGAKQLTH